MARKPNKPNKDGMLALPPVLSFRRSFEITDAILRAGRSCEPAGETVPINVYDQGKRTTASYEARKNAGDADAKGEDARNLAYGEDAKLPTGRDLLVAEFKIRVLPIHSQPDACDKPAWMAALQAAIQSEQDEQEAIKRIARFYAYNLANGAWLWRNRDVAESLRIEVDYGDPNSITRVSEALDLPLHPVSPASSAEPDPHKAVRQIDALSQAIAEVLAARRPAIVIRVTARARLLAGQSIWPSQRFMPVKEKVGKVEKGRVFFKVDGDAAITAEKVGAALRCFDKDHGSELFPNAIISVEPNGGSLRFGVNLRGAGRRIYDLLPRFVAPYLPGAPSVTPLSLEDRCFVLACLVRGGVLGAKEASTAAGGSDEDANAAGVTETDADGVLVATDAAQG